MIVCCSEYLIKSLEYNFKGVHSGCKVPLPEGQKFSRNECLGLAGPKTANSLELIFVTEFSLRTSRNSFSRWTDLKRCKGKNEKINDKALCVISSSHCFTYICYLLGLKPGSNLPKKYIYFVQ